jgi:ABC-2 type transport system permease protein
MKSIKKNLRIMFAVANATYKEWAAYRSHSLVSLFVGPAFFTVQYFIWKAVFTNQQTVNDFTFAEIITYYGISTLINYCIMDFADWNLQFLIQTGRFATFMLRPVSHRFFALSQKVGHRMLGFIFEFIPVYFIFYFIFRIPLIPANIFWAVISLVLGYLMMFLVDYCVGMTAFWLVKSGGIRSMFNLLRDVFTGVLIPLTFFPGAIQKILLYLPFQYISYVPVRVFLGSYELAGIKIGIPQIVALQAAAVLIMWAVSEAIWRLGIKRFIAVGI